MSFPILDHAIRLKRLAPPRNKIRIVIDTDTFNEIDDQFAIAYALKSQNKFDVEAIYAAPFFNHLSTGPADGMEKSYEEIHKILALMKQSPNHFVYRGSTGYLPDLASPYRSPAALDLVQRAMNSPEDDPLYVVAIGAITNVASAILIEPRIVEKIVVVWLGGHALHWPHTKEFNLEQDILASRVLLDCGVPLVLIPCMGVTSHLSTTLSEIKDYVKGNGTLGDYLFSTYKNCHNDHFAYSRIIWDISTIAYLVNPDWVTTDIIHSPILTDQITWSVDTSRHFIRYASSVNRDGIFRDLFTKLTQ